MLFRHHKKKEEEEEEEEEEERQGEELVFNKTHGERERGGGKRCRFWKSGKRCRGIKTGHTPIHFSLFYS